MHALARSCAAKLRQHTMHARRTMHEAQQHLHSEPLPALPRLQPQVLRLGAPPVDRWAMRAPLLAPRPGPPLLAAASAPRTSTWAPLHARLAPSMQSPSVLVSQRVGPSID
jgi:hypothetical protein